MNHDSTFLIVPLLSDELIRQVTIECAERGALLLMVRDQIQMTFGVYQALNEGSMAFGTRKALQAELGKADEEKTVRTFRGFAAVFL